MHATTLHARADLWQRGAARFAALFMEGEMRSPDDEVGGTGVLLYAVMNRGLRLATDLPRLALRPRPGWAAHLNSAGALTLTWPHVQPLLLDAPLNLPTGWREAAAEHGLVLLFVGDSLGLRDHTKDHQANPGQRSAEAAERGELAAGAIAYHDHVRDTWLGRPAARQAPHLPENSKRSGNGVYAHSYLPRRRVVAGNCRRGVARSFVGSQRL